jgi:hypothetical protein
MDVNKYGPFANTIAIAGALVAVFAVLLLKMVGRSKQWSWLVDYPPTFLLTAGSRFLAIALMALTYVTISKSNYIWFALVAVMIGIIGIFMIIRFDLLRKIHVIQVVQTGPGGQPLMSETDELLYKNIVIGTEANMTKEAKKELAAARKAHGSIGIEEYMRGNGDQINNPNALWSREILASISNKLTLYLVNIFICGVMVLFLAAFVIEVYTRK